MIQMQNNKPVCTENILHITSGEMTANALRELLPQEEILPFNEAMCEGEVHIEIFTDEFYRLRAAAYGVELEDYLQKSPGSFMQNRLKDYPVLYLYFDYDMFCTVNIITLLAFLEQSGYSGRIKFHLLEADGSVAILDTWPVLLGIYEKCYCRVLLKRQRFITGNELFDKGIELYLEYKKRNNRIIRYIKAHSMEEQKHLVRDLVLKFADYGLTDIAAARFITACRDEKMKKQIMTFILTVVMALGICGAVSAAEAGNVVGYVNVQQVFQSYPDIKTTMSAVDLERQKAQQEFESKAASLDDSGKQALGEKLSQQVAKREQDLMGPIQKKVQKAIATVAKRAGINSVVDSSAMLYGGKDLTGDVIAEVLK